MSRSGYSDGVSHWGMIRWRGAVTSAIRGARGQAFLRELLAALDAMPVKSLAANSFEVEASGEVCALGALGRARGLDLSKLDPEDCDNVGEVFGVADALAREVMEENDGALYWCDVSEPNAGQERWRRVRAWVAGNIKEDGQ